MYQRKEDLIVGLIIESTDGYPLCASSSSILGTEVSNNYTKKITISHGSDSAYIRFLRTPAGNTYPNSIILEIRWGSSTGKKQEVVLMIPDKNVSTIVWSKDDTKIDNTFKKITGTLKVKVNGTDSTNSYNAITKLTLFQYYISKTSPTSRTGSYNSPGKAYHAATSSHWTGTKRHARSLTFIPPSGSVKPNYYVVIAYKSWQALADGGIGQMFILDGTATSLLDKSEYWDGAWGKLLRYTVYAVYSNGIKPSFKDDAQLSQNESFNSGSRNNVYPYMLWVKFMEPDGSLVQERWYNRDTGRLLLDNTKQTDLEYSVISGTKVIVPDYSANYDAAAQEVKDWRIKKRTATSWGSTSYTDASLANYTINSDTDFGVSFKNRKFLVHYDDSSSGGEKTFEREYGQKVKIDPNGGIWRDSSSTSTIEIKKETYIEPATRTDYVFLGWKRTTSGEYIVLTAQWQPTHINIAYDPNGGNGNIVVKRIPYNTIHTVLLPSELNFTAPQTKPIFISWNTGSDGRGDSYSPGNSILATSPKTLYAQWGSPWKRVKWIWIYDPDEEGQDGHWKRYKPWVNIR